MKRELEPRRGYRSHPWDLTPREAIALQRELAPLVVREDRLGAVRRVAGVDVGFRNGGRTTRVAVAVLDFPSLEPVDRVTGEFPTCFPYVPGLLSFREVPAVLRVWDRLRQVPDLLLCDGQGLAHPRRLGIACHLGLLLDLPSIGVAKSRLIGEHEEPPQERGAWVPLLDGEEVIGAVLRTRVGVKPLYVSIGHRVSLPTAIDYVMKCTTRYRLPETTRMSHRLASQET
ncbi:MAG: deoxyribonuclease V [Gammaproteobacteria bacterium]|nr:MAG: deoxyribonuclease V [Gammaproteobacteria bacterium]